jgi:hypothetical protein
MEAIARRAAAPIFALALFSSAGLIFVLQPLFARMVTPLLGGSPQVWNTSMAFFQGALLVGYLYAHLLQRVKDLRVQAIVHVAVLAAAWLVLPVHVTTLLGEPSSEHPALWLVGVLALSVGAPFAAASATAPLLQAWYARTGRSDAHDPYYLYAASNLGSFGGLLAYPALIEPLLGAHAQSQSWTAAYIFVAALIALAGAIAISTRGEAPKPLEHVTGPPTWKQRGYWVAAAAVPSALSLGVTLHIVTDVASAPMLWVAPLALYLATFVLAFMKGGEKLEGPTLLIHPFAIALMVMSYYASGNWIASVSSILAGFFFSALVCHLALARTRPSADRLTEFYLYVSLGGVIGGTFAALIAPLIFNNIYEYPLALAAVCLFRPRGTSDMPRLSDASFAGAIASLVLGILLMNWAALDSVLVLAALGGAAAMIAAGWTDEAKPPPFRYAFLGAAALHAALVIWVAFNKATIFLPQVSDGRTTFAATQPWDMLMMASSFLVLVFAVHATIQRRRDNRRVADFALGAAMPSLILLIMVALSAARMDAQALTILGILFCALAIFLNRTNPIVLAITVLIAFTLIFLDDQRGGRIITQERTFFGVLRTRVYEVAETGVPPLRVLMHGTTLHGAQIDAPGLSRLPLTYYHPRTALGESILAGLSTNDPASLALIGLGTGSTACLMRPNDHLTIYEIDPEVVRLSVEPGGDFTFVPQCQPNAQVVLGDARLRIADAPDASYDVIVVDAFSSDAIPAHLLTREAIALYLSKVRESGIVILHLSNRNLALVSEASRVARDLNIPNIHRVSDNYTVEGASMYGASAASVMILAHSPEVLNRLVLPSNDWVHLQPRPGPGWTDDYINVPRALWENLNGEEECWLYSYLPHCQEGQATEQQPATPAAPASP